MAVSQSLDSEFWQYLAGAELPPQKSRSLLQGIGFSGFSPLDYLRHHADLTPQERKRLASIETESLKLFLKSGGRILVEDEYPETLAQALPNFPPALFVQGNSECLSGPTVGIVGTRNATPYGKACAHKFAEALAAAGVTIVSGGALGIDAAAHRGALAAGGSTIAVLASGVDFIYPNVHEPLFRQIQAKGCLVSQYATGVKPMDYKFLARNAIIAALSQALIVVQAPTRSGALSTANEAAELGREVFVVPGNIDAIEFRGSFNLIRDGATLVYHPDQVLESLGIERRTAEPQAASTSVGETILSALGVEPMDAERIAEVTGIPAGELLSELTMLELDGLVQREAGGYIRKL